MPQIADVVERLVRESGLDRRAIKATVLGSPGVYDEALLLTENATERAFLERRLAGLPA